MDVLLTDAQALEPLDLELWRGRLVQAMRMAGEPDSAQLSVVFVDDARIGELNRQYRAQDRPTDVLAFPLLAPHELEDSQASGPVRALGDVVVSVESARRQAAEYGHSLEREIGFLLAHGLLHLLGEDHQTPEQGARMRARQRELLGAWRLDR